MSKEGEFLPIKHLPSGSYYNYRKIFLGRPDIVPVKLNHNMTKVSTVDAEGAGEEGKREGLPL